MLELSWPNPKLSPNSRSDRRYSTKERQAYRDEGYYKAKALGLRAYDKPLLCVMFSPPDNRRRDLDNMFGSIKYAIDGIASAMGMDDYEFAYKIVRLKPVKGGSVFISFGLQGE